MIESQGTIIALLIEQLAIKLRERQRFVALDRVSKRDEREDSYKEMTLHYNMIKKLDLGN